MKDNRTKILRNKIAREAALLLYTSQEKEFKQAKLRASATLGGRVLPSNFEVAEELDIIADEREGRQRKELLLRMRKEARQIMEKLTEFNPLLLGSVWRGTARKNSDIDIQVFSENHLNILEQLQMQGYLINRTECRSVTKGGMKRSSVHIQVLVDSGDIIEIVVRNPENLGKTQRCETYGDLKTGLNLQQLTKVLENNPLQKFVPL